MGYAAATYCFNTGAEATAALSAQQQGMVLNTTKTGECPLIWNAAGYAVQQTYNTTSNACTVGTARVYFPTCTTVGDLAPEIIADPIGDSTAFYAIAIVFLATIWAGKKIYSLFHRETL